MKQHEGKWQYTVTQRSFIENTKPGKVPSARLQQGGELTPEEMSEFRSTVGSNGCQVKRGQT